jgi:[glutamine synthetase] adenylyltransferase / [glutamine synthetase]-adenylyl-L-tyrosine phosphorylase
VSPRRAAEGLSDILPPALVAPLAAHLVRLPDPEGAVRLARRLAAAGALPTDPSRLHALMTLGGCSPYLGGLLHERPDLLDALPTGGPGRGLPTREDLEEELARSRYRDSATDVPTILRRFKEREYLRIALADLLRTADLAAVTRALSLLADVLIDSAVTAAAAALEARHGRPTFRNERGEVEASEFAVLGLGKLGGEELNYSSDIDIIYLFARDGETRGVGAAGAGAISNREFFTRLAADVTRLIGGTGSEGEIFRIDLNLRPGGRDGDLVISESAAVAYYRGWAEPWERQALIKVRPVGGSAALGRRFAEAVEPLVYSPTPDPYLAVEMVAMKDRIDGRLSEQGHSERDVKLGRGGIRELEFGVQALQLQRGGADRWLRQGNTLLALHRLADRGLVGFAEYAALAEAYVFLRDVEHRLQLWQNRQTALLPTDPAALRGLARNLWLVAPPRDDEPAALAVALERHRGAVRAFYDSALGRASQVAIAEDTSDLLLDRLDDTALLGRLRRLDLPGAEGLLKPVQNLRRLLQPARLSPDLTRALRRAGPLLVQAAAGSSNPRRALLNLETLLSAMLPDPEGLLRLLAHREILTPAVRLLGRSDLLTGLLVRQPEILRALEDRGRLVRAADPDEERARLIEAAEAPGEPGARAAELRRRHQAALAATALRDINRLASVREVVKSLSHLADGAVEAALRLARDEAGGLGPGTRLAVIGLGRLGYRELDYGSDLDLLFVHETEGDDQAARRARASDLCAGVVRILSTHSRDGQIYRVDLRLRPSGSKGDLVASPRALADYFTRGADVWEMQSFLKARPVAGDRALGEQVVGDIERLILTRAAAIPEAELVSTVRDMRERLTAAGRPDPEARRPKLGRGGLADIDFAIEYLQLRHGVTGPRDKDTLRLLTHLASAHLLGEEEMRAFYEGYLFLRALDHEMRLLGGAPADALPADPRRLQEIASALPEFTDAPESRAALYQAWDLRTAAVRRAFDTVVTIPGFSAR